MAYKNVNEATPAPVANTLLGITPAGELVQVPFSLGVSVKAATWADLSLLMGSAAGQGAEVLDTDTGTHTDPVVGGGTIVPNAGSYTWSTAPSGWKWIGATGLGQVQTDVDKVEAQTALLSSYLYPVEGIYDKAFKMLVTGPDALDHTLLDVVTADGALTFYNKVNVPAGNWTMESLSDEIKNSLPFEVNEGLLLSAFRIISTGPDGHDYVHFDISRDGTVPINAFVSRALVADNAGEIVTLLTSLVGSGDSMMAAGSGLAETIPGAFPDRSCFFSAEGGERTNGIAVSFGVPDLLTLTLTGGLLPTSGVADVTPAISFLNVGVCSQIDVVVETGATVRCQIYNDGTYHIRPAVYPAAPIRVRPAARSRVVSLQRTGTDPSLAQLLDPLYDMILIARPGRNDISWDRGYDGPALTSLVRRMCDLMRTGRYIVLGPTNGTADVPTALGGLGAVSEANSLITLSNAADLNSRFAVEFGGHYYSPIANFVATGHTTDFTVSGTTFAVVNNTVLSDGVHENALGKDTTTDLIEFAVAEWEY